MNKKFKDSFTSKLESVYGDQMGVYKSKLSEADIEKYNIEQVEKQNRKNAAKRRQQNLQQFKLNVEQRKQITEFCKKDQVLAQNLVKFILQETELGQLIKKKLYLNSLKEMNKGIIEFRQKMTERIQKIFIKWQNQTILKLKQILQDKTQILIQILQQKLPDIGESGIKENISLILAHEMEEQSKKHIRLMGQQLNNLYEQILVILSQHIQNNKSERELSLLKCVNQLKEQMKYTETEYIRRLSIDINQSYSKCITNIIQVQQKLKQY